MLDFNQYLARHGETGVQAIIEQIERVKGLRSAGSNVIPLEARWKRVMQDQAVSQLMAA